MRDEQLGYSYEYSRSMSVMQMAHLFMPVEVELALEFHKLRVDVLVVEGQCDDNIDVE